MEFHPGPIDGVIWKPLKKFHGEDYSPNQPAAQQFPWEFTSLTNILLAHDFPSL